MPRFPAVIMATCVVPWTETYALDEAAFRREVHDLARNLTRYLYVFGTAGEGYAVTEAQFERICRVFGEACGESGAEGMVGIIHLSLPAIQERIERAKAWGFRRFQISLPSWGALSDRELRVFFRETCGEFPDCEFMHYNLRRAKRLLEAAEYAELAAAHPNLVATKNTLDDEAFLTALLTEAGELRHFLSEAGYARMRDRYEAGLLISLASTHPERAQVFFHSRGEKLARFGEELRGVLTALKEAMGEGAYIDGAYDKILYKLGRPDFPLRLLPPYEATDDAAVERFRDALARLAPAWIPPR